jgi:hypothetical protein
MSGVRERAAGELRKRYQQMMRHGVSVKAALAELVGVAGVVLLGGMVMAYCNYSPHDKHGASAMPCASVRMMLFSHLLACRHCVPNASGDFARPPS